MSDMVNSDGKNAPHCAPDFSITHHPSPITRFLGLVDYETTWRAMQQFTAQRTAETRDEIWLLQHPPTYTQGQAGKPEHLLNAHNIPVVQIDRGGQITYHGPGQIVAYLLLDLRRWHINVRELVRLMEQAVIDVLTESGIVARGRTDAPGVYVGDAKIASLGLKIKNSCCYHGLALNVDMDLTPFAFINPCGYAGMRVTQISDFNKGASVAQIEQRLAQRLTALLYTHVGAAAGRDSTPSRPAAAPTQDPGHGNLALRKGRVSLPNQVYLITTTTADRQKFFADFTAAGTAARCFEDEQLLGDARILAWVLMPDHVHWLLQLGEKHDLGTLVRRLKSSSALQVNRTLGRTGKLWAEAYHDHAVRKDEHLQDIARYIVANPLRAGLVEHIGDYPFWNAIWL